MAVYSVKDYGSLSMNKSDDLCIHFLESLYDCAQSELLPVRIDAYPYKHHNHNETLCRVI